MKIISVGKNGKVGNVTMIRTMIVTDDISKIEALVEIQENGEIIHLDLEGNEVHTPESYAKKITVIRREVFEELEQEISNLKNEITKSKLNSRLEELKQLPATSRGQFEFRKRLGYFKDFASDLGAKIVAEIAMKQLGY